jgi:hypothetical protein
MNSPFEAAAGFKPVQRALLAAPVIFICHVAEEAPGFVAWANAHVEPDITPQMFWSVNLSGLVMTLLAIGAARLQPSPASFLLVAGWLSFLMLANAALHLTATIMFQSYVPGVITALLLYLPYCFWVINKMLHAQSVRRAPMLTAVIIGAILMLLHGYLIVFEGRRLF